MSDLASTSGEGTDVTLFTMSWGVEMGKSDYTCLRLLAALLREVLKSFSPVPKFFPLAFVSCSWTHHFCPDSHFSLAQEMLNEMLKSQS